MRFTVKTPSFQQNKMENLFSYLTCCPSTEVLVYVSELIFILKLVRIYNPIFFIVCLAQQYINSFKLIHLRISIKFYNMCTEVPLEHSHFVKEFCRKILVLKTFLQIYV